MAAASTTERKRSLVWIYFTLINSNEAKRTICAKTVRYCGNTTNLTKHLRNVHPEAHDKLNEKRATQAEEDTKKDKTTPPKQTQSILEVAFVRGKTYPGNVGANR